MAPKKESKPKIKNKASMDEAAMARKFQKFRTEQARAADKKAKPSMKITKTNLDKTARGPKPGASTVAAVAKRFGITVREAGDIAKALKNVAESGKSALNLDRTGNQYLGRQAVKATGKDLAKQIKEFGSAVKSGKPGSRAGKISYNSDTQTPQGLKGKPNIKYGRPRPPYKSGKGFGPYPENK